MSRILKFMGYAVSALLALIGVALIAVYQVSAAKLRQKHTVTAKVPPILTDAAAVEGGNLRYNAPIGRLCDTLTPEGFFVAQILAHIGKAPHDAHANGRFPLRHHRTENGRANQQGQRQQ